MGCPVACEAIPPVTDPIELPLYLGNSASIRKKNCNFIKKNRQPFTLSNTAGKVMSGIFMTISASRLNFNNREFLQKRKMDSGQTEEEKTTNIV